MIRLQFFCDNGPECQHARIKFVDNLDPYEISWIEYLPPGWAIRKGSETTQIFCSTKCRNEFESYLLKKEQKT